MRLPYTLRLFLTMLFANLGGGVVTFVHFRFFDPTALEGAAPLGMAEVAYFLLAFLALLMVGRFVFRRWARHVIRATDALPDGPQGARLRRRAVMVPAFLALLSLSGWVLAALIWGFIWPLLAGYFSLAGALRQSFAMIFVAGPMVMTVVFLGTERIWRERLPVLFPTGDLATTGATTLSVRSRMRAVFLLMSVVPMLLLSVSTFVRIRSLHGADPQTAQAILQSLMLVQAVLVGTGVALAVLLATFLADSVASPLRQLQQAMHGVEQGRLDVVCPVVSNDEIGSVTEGFNRMVLGLREREWIRETFGKYVSPQVRDEILAGRANLAGGQCEVTILFADLRGFSTWAETSPAVEVVQGLNAYFTEMDRAIRAHGGLVLQFIGDEIEAVFGAPLADARHADHAVAAALEMQSRLEAWNLIRRSTGERELQHGIGIHSGTVLAGNIGSSERMSYTLVGDAVNVASRIETLNKQFASRILVSSATRDQMADASKLQALSSVLVKGRSAEVQVFRLA